MGVEGLAQPQGSGQRTGQRAEGRQESCPEEATLLGGSPGEPPAIVQPPAPTSGGLTATSSKPDSSRAGAPSPAPPRSPAPHPVPLPPLPAPPPSTDCPRACAAPSPLAGPLLFSAKPPAPAPAPRERGLRGTPRNGLQQNSFQPASLLCQTLSSRVGEGGSSCSSVGIPRTRLHSPLPHGRWGTAPLGLGGDVHPKGPGSRVWETSLAPKADGWGVGGWGGEGNQISLKGSSWLVAKPPSHPTL